MNDNIVIDSIKINGVDGKRVIGIKGQQPSFSYKNKGLYSMIASGALMNAPTLPGADVANGLSSVAASLDGLKDMFYYLLNPMEFLKILAQCCIDLSFSVTAIVSIVALCMFIFTGCKDKQPLKYVGLSVAAMYIITVIFSAFITMV